MEKLLFRTDETSSNARLHSIDRKEYDHQVFTPYSATDPESGVKYFQWNPKEESWERIDSEDYFFMQSIYDDPYDFEKYYMREVGVTEDNSLRFVRMQSLIKLLQKIFEGTEANTDTYIGLFRGIYDGFEMLSFRLPILQSISITNGGDYIDFPQRLLFAYRLKSRAIAWRLAWVLVRAAWLEKWDIVDDLIQEISVGRGGKNSKSRSEIVSQLIEGNIAILKQEVLV